MSEAVRALEGALASTHDWRRDAEARLERLEREIAELRTSAFVHDE